MPQVRGEAGPGTKIIYCFIIHICLRWNIYMRMDNSLVHFIRVAWGTFRQWIYPHNPPPTSFLIFKWSRCSSSLPLIGWRAGPWLGNTGPDWAIRGGGTGINFFYVMVAFRCHDLFLKIIISLVKTVHLCFYIFTPMCHISDCHVHRISYVQRSLYIESLSQINLSLLKYLFPFHLHFNLL